MTITLEVSGGIAAPLGPQVITVDLDRLPAADAAALRAAVSAVPATVWGQALLAPHPHPGDLRHVLRVDDGGTARVVTFHARAAPPALGVLAGHLLARGPS